MKTTSPTATTSPRIRLTSATLAETFWFVSSFVMSLIMGPFTALPALIALFSLESHGPLPLSATE